MMQIDYLFNLLFGSNAPKELTLQQEFERIESHPINREDQKYYAKYFI